MASSLQDLLTKEGFRRKKTKKSKLDEHQHRPRSASPSSRTAPVTISLCRDRRSVDLSRQRGRTDPDNSTASHSRRRVLSEKKESESEYEYKYKEYSTSSASSISGIISTLAGYVGRYINDERVRSGIREKCLGCLKVRKDATHVVFVNLQMGMENVERLAAALNSNNETKIRSLRNSIRLLTMVASLNSAKSRHGFTCGVPNSHLSACAQLYLAVVYKMDRKDRISARHLLQVFIDAPYLARRNLLPDLWEDFFLPHLIHLRAWFNKEVEVLSEIDVVDERKRNNKRLNRVYNDQMDLGTSQFAVYYKDWLKVGGDLPVVPSVLLPPTRSYGIRSGKRSLSASPCSVNRTLYQAVFGDQRDDDDDDYDIEGEDDEKQTGRNHVGGHHRRRHSIGGHENAPSTNRKSTNPFRMLACRNDTYRGVICRSQISKSEPRSSITPKETTVPLINLGRAITLISTSDSLSECETAVRVVSNAWLDSDGDPVVETALSTISVIEGLLEVTLTSKDEEVLELSISILAELVTRNDGNRQVVLNADPQLEIFLRILASKNLFLKVASFLYVLKPKAKQMLSLEWVALVLRVLEFGTDDPQTLFGVKCSPKSAAFYLLDQLLNGFDVDRNVENAREVVTLGGLNLLMTRLETVADAGDRNNVASFLATCVKADGSCRDYLASNMKKASIHQLLVGNQLNTHSLTILLELLCLKRRTQVTNFLLELKNEGCMSTMHVLLVHLQQSPPEQRPLVAAILLHLDLLGDPSRYSVYREEVIDVIVWSLDCTNSRKIQERCSRALLVLGGRFSSIGEPATESWLLKRAGLDESSCPPDLYTSAELSSQEFMGISDEEENETEDWLRKVASVLLSTGKKRLLVALENCIGNGIPCLGRSCLVTVAWMINSLSLLQNATALWSLASSILIPRLLECLNYDRALEERVLATISLLNFARNSGRRLIN